MSTLERGYSSRLPIFVTTLDTCTNELRFITGVKLLAEEDDSTDDTNLQRSHTTLESWSSEIPIEPDIIRDSSALFDQENELTIPILAPVADSQWNNGARHEARPSKESFNNQNESKLNSLHLPPFQSLGRPEDLATKLNKIGYECLPYLAVQLSLFLQTPVENRIKALLLEGPSGCGKSFFAKSLAKIVNAELMVLSCYRGMPTQNLIEAPSSFALASAMAGAVKKSDESSIGSQQPEQLMNLGIITRAFLRSQTTPVILLVDELDKPDTAIDTFFLGPIQDATVWLESRPAVHADPDNLIIIFTKNFNRVLDDALLRRCHPIKMTYLDARLETKILSGFCHPQLVKNLVGVADRMRNSGGTYGFERPPAPEELLLAGLYITKLLDWGIKDFAEVAQSVWAILAKSEHDRAVLEHMLRFHPDFMDPLVPDPKNAPFHEILGRLGRVLLEEIIADPDEEKRKKAWAELEY